jgi:hypothetical protein
MSTELNSQNVQKILDVSIILSKVLEYAFQENQGIVINVSPELTSFSDSKKVIVYKKEGAIQITTTNQEIKEGTIIQI